MKIVSSAMRKGGTGKSTLSLHLAHFVARQKKKVLLVDVDSQGNSARSFIDALPDAGISQLYQKGGASRVRVVPATDVENIHVIGPDAGLKDVRPEHVPRFVENLRLVGERGGFDYVILDTPPTPRDDLAAPLDVSDFVFVPVIPDRYGIENAYDLNRMIQEARARRNSGPQFLGFVINQFNPRISGHRSVLEAMQEAFGDELCPSVINYRAAYVNASFESKPIWSTLDGQRSLGGAAREASKEMRGALSWLFKKMEAHRG